MRSFLRGLVARLGIRRPGLQPKRVGTTWDHVVGARPWDGTTTRITQADQTHDPATRVDWPLRLIPGESFNREDR